MATSDGAQPLQVDGVRVLISDMGVETMSAVERFMRADKEQETVFIDYADEFAAAVKRIRAYMEGE